MRRVLMLFLPPAALAAMAIVALLSTPAPLAHTPLVAAQGNLDELGLEGLGLGVPNSKRFLLKDVPNNTILVVQSSADVDSVGELYAADGTTLLRRVNNFLNQKAFRITYPVTNGPTTFELQARESVSSTLFWAVNARALSVVGTVEYNQPAGMARTIPPAANQFESPIPHHYRLVVPQAAAGLEVTVRASNNNNDAMRVELLNADGSFIAHDTERTASKEIKRTLAPGNYLLAVDGWIGDNGGNRNAGRVRDYVVTLSGPQVGFAADDVTRTVAEGEAFMLTAALSGGMAAEDITLDVAYSGGDGYEGPKTVTIPAGASSAELPLNVLNDGEAGSVPDPLVVTLSLRDDTVISLSAAAAATVTFADRDLELGTDTGSVSLTEAGEVHRWYLKDVPKDKILVVQSLFDINVVGFLYADAADGRTLIRRVDNFLNQKAFRITYPVPVTEGPANFVLEVHGVGSTTGDYGLLAESVNVVGTVEYNQPAFTRHTLAASGLPSTHYHRVLVPASGLEVTVRASDSMGDDMRAELLNADGSFIANDFDDTADKVFTRTLDAGEYLLAVNGWIGQNDGNRNQGRVRDYAVTLFGPLVAVYGFTFNEYLAVEGETLEAVVEIKSGSDDIGDNMPISYNFLGLRAAGVSSISKDDPSDTLTFTVPDDGNPDTVPDDEVITLTHTAGPGVLADAFSTINVRIAKGRAGFNMTTFNADGEGQGVTLMVELAGAAAGSGGLTLGLDYMGGSGTTGPSTVTIDAGENSAMLQLTAPRDRMAGSVADPLVVTLVDNDPDDGFELSPTAKSVTITAINDRDLVLGLIEQMNFLDINATHRWHLNDVPDDTVLVVHTLSANSDIGGHLGLTKWLRTADGMLIRRNALSFEPRSYRLTHRVTGGNADFLLDVQLVDSDDGERGPYSLVVDTEPLRGTVPYNDAEGVGASLPGSALPLFHYYRVEVPTTAAGETVTIRVANGHGDQMRAELLRADGSLVEYRRNGSTEHIFRRVLDPDEYIVAVSGVGSAGPGNTRNQGRVRDYLVTVSGPGDGVGFAADDVARTVAENAEFTLTVELAGDAADEDITLNVDYSGGGGYTGPSSTVTIDAGDNSATLQLEAPRDGIAGSAPETLTVTLTDNDPNDDIGLFANRAMATITFANRDLALGGSMDTAEVTDADPRHFWYLKGVPNNELLVVNAYNDFDTVGRLFTPEDRVEDRTVIKRVDNFLNQKAFRITHLVTNGPVDIILEVRGANDARGTYGVLAELGTVIGTVEYNQPAGPEQTILASFAPSTHYYRLVVPQDAAGLETTLRVSNTNGDAMRVELLRTDGRFITGESEHTASKKIERTLAPGKYLLAVNGWIGQNEGNMNQEEVVDYVVTLRGPDPINRPALALNRTARGGNLGLGPIHHWPLNNVPDDTILVVQSINDNDVVGRLLTADGRTELRRVDNFLNQKAFRITYPVTEGPANFILEVRGSGGNYAVLAETVNVVDTVEYNQPAGPKRTIAANIYGFANYHRVVVPPEAAGREITLNVSNDKGDGMRVELLNEDGTFIAHDSENTASKEIKATLAEGKYLLAVSGWIGGGGGNRDQGQVRDYVVTLRGPQVGFAADDVARTVAEDEAFMLTVELEDGNTATQTVTLGVDYSGGGGTTGTTEVTINAGENSATLQLEAPRDGMPGSAPAPLTVTLTDNDPNDGFGLSPTGAAAVITFANRDLALNGSMNTAEVTDASPRHLWYLKDVPNNALLVAQTYGELNSVGRLFAEDDTTLIKRNDNFLNQQAFRITHQLTGVPGGNTNLILEVRGSFGARGAYGLIAETATVVGTVGYNQPAGPAQTITSGFSPSPHYHRLVVPTEADGQAITLSASNPNGDAMRVELLRADGTFEAKEGNETDDKGITRTLATGEYLLAVNGWIGSDGGNMNQGEVVGYVVTLRGPEFVGFAADDQTRAVEVGQQFTLTVAVAPGLGVATEDVTLDVGYMGGGGNFMGPAMVTIPAGAASAELMLQAPAAAALPLTVTLSNPSSGSQLLQDFAVATVTFTGGQTAVGFTAGAATVVEGEDLTLTVELEAGRTADAELTLNVEYSYTGGDYTGPLTIMIPQGADSAELPLKFPANGIAGADQMLTVTLIDPNTNDDIVPSPTAAEAVITVINRDLAPDRMEVTGELTQAGQVDRWYLTAVRADALLVVQSLNQIDVQGKLLDADGMELKDVNDFLNQKAFRITHRVSGTADLTLEVSGRGNSTGEYGLFAELANVVSTLEYNAPEGSRITLPTSRLPFPHYHRVVVPPEAAGQEVTVRVASDFDVFRIELMNNDGTFIANSFGFNKDKEIKQTLTPGDYLLAVNGWITGDPDNLNQGQVRKYGVTLRGPAVAGFATDDLSRTVAADGEQFTLMVELAPGLGAALQTVTLSVTYSGGFTGPATVMIPQGGTSAVLTLQAPAVAPPPLTVTLDNPSSGSALRQNFIEATVTFTGSRAVGFADTAVTVGENEDLTLTVELADRQPADAALTLNVDYSGGGGATGSSTVTINAGASSAELLLKIPRDGVAGTAPETLTVTLSLSPGGDVVLPPTGAEAVITILNRDLELGGGEVTGEFTQDDERHRWYLMNVPNNTLLVVQSLNNQNTEGRLLTGDGNQELRKVDNFLNQRAFRITHQVTGVAGGSTDFILEVSSGFRTNLRGTYGLFAETGNVVGTVEYNQPAGMAQTIETSTLPTTHYYRVIVPEGAAGQEITLRARNDSGDEMRVELLRAVGRWIANEFEFQGGDEQEIERTLDPGEYLFAVNGWVGRSEGNRDQDGVQDYVVTLRGPEVVGFAMDDLNRMVAADGGQFTLTVAVAPGLGVAGQAVTLDVEYSGGFTGPAMVTIPQGAASAELMLQAPAAAPAPVTVTLSNPPSGSALLQGSDVATITFTGPRVVGFTDTAATVDENEDLTLTVELARGRTADGDLTLNVDYGGSGSYEGPDTVTILDGASSATLQLKILADGAVGTAPETLTVTLRVMSGDLGNVELSPTGAEATITILNRDLATDRIEVTGELTQAGEAHRWYLRYLPSVPEDMLLVVQSLNARVVNVKGRLLNSDDILLREVDDFLTGNSFRITHRVTSTADLILEVSGVGSSRGTYGLIAELADVVGTVEYNRPEGTPMTISRSALPQTHYVRLVVPPEAAEQTVTVIVTSASQATRLELLRANGTLIEKRNDFNPTRNELTQVLDPGEYYLALNGWIGFQGGNRNQSDLRDYVVTLRGPEFVGFAADDLSRTVLENEPFTLTVAVAPGLGVATRDLTLDVGYMGGGGNFMGPATVTIPEGASSAELTLTAPDNMAAGTVMPLTVTLSNPPSGSILLQGSEAATVAFTDVPLVAFLADDRSQTVNEGEMVTLRVVVVDNVPLTSDIDLLVRGIPGEAPRSITIPMNGGPVSLTFTAPDNDRIGDVPSAVRLTLEVAPGEVGASVDPSGGARAVITIADLETLEAGAIIIDRPDSGRRGIHEVTQGNPHRWSFVVEGTERQFVILQTTGDHTQVSRNADVRGRLFDSTGALLAEADDSTRYGTRDGDRHSYFRIERWLDPGAYVLEVRTDEGSTRETYGILADFVPQVMDLALGETFEMDRLWRGSGPLARFRSRSLPWYFRLEVPEALRGEELTIAGSKANDQGNRRVPQARLLDSQGGFIAESSHFEAGIANETFRFRQILEPGTYYVAVQTIINNRGGDREVTRIGGVAHDLLDGLRLSFTAPPVAQFADGNPDTVAENGDVTLEVELTGGTTAANDLTLNVQYAGGDGYKGPSAVTIPRGRSSATLQLNVPGNSIAGTAPNPLTVTLVETGDVKLSSTGRVATITITDGEVVTVGFGAASYVFTEGEQVTVPVELKGGVVPVGEIMVTVAGIPKQPPRMVTLSAANRSEDITFMAPDDSDARVAPDDVMLTLSAPQGVGVADSGRTTLRFRDDNDPVAEARFGGELTQEHFEGEMVTLRVQLQQGVPATRAIEVRVELSGGLDGERTLTIEAGTEFGLLPITLPNDEDDIVAPPAVVATLIGPPPGSSDLYRVVNVPAERVVNVEIRDDDAEPSAGFGETEYTFAEDTQVTVSVGLTGIDPTGPVTVMVAGIPGRTMPLEVMLSADTRSRDITFTAPKDDLANIAPPAIELTLRVMSGNADLLEGSESAIVRFMDDDPVAEVLFADDLTPFGKEGATATLRVQLQGSLTATRAIMVQVALSGGTETVLTITIPENANSGEVSFALPADNDRNTVPAEVVATLLSGGDRYAVAAGTDRQAAIAVTDDATRAEVGFAETTLTAAAGEMATLRVALVNNVPATQTVSVLVNFDDGRAPETVTIEAGKRFAPLQVQVSAEELVLTLSTPTNAVLADGSGMARIMPSESMGNDGNGGPVNVSPPSPQPPGDDMGGGDEGGSGGGGGPMLMLTVTPAGPSEVSEGDEITYTITRAEEDAVDAISVEIGVSPRSSGARANDLATVETVELAAGATSIQHVVTALLDADDESDERFAITFTPVDEGGSPLGPQQSSELTVTNLAFGLMAVGGTELSEGDVALVRVTRPEGVALNQQYTLMIEAMRVNPRGAATGDLQVPATVILRSGRPFVDFRVQALRDMEEEEEDERFSVTVAGAGTLTFTVTEAAHLPGAGGAALGWGVLAALLTLALLATATGGALLTRRSR